MEHIALLEKLGRAAVDSNEIYIDGLEVPVENVVGEVGQYSVRSPNACVRSTLRCACSEMPPACAQAVSVEQRMSRAACRMGVSSKQRGFGCAGGCTK